MDKFMNLISQGLSGIGPFFLLLGLLIFVHELGHFLVAKFFGVRVEVFSLGFGKKILQKKWGDTAYCLSLIPLGGYVKMYGDNPSVEIPAELRRYSFLHKPVWPRIAIVLAGPLMNLFFAILLFAVIGSVGEEMPAPVVGDLSATSKAYAVGFRSGDKVLQVNSENIASWVHLRQRVESSGGKTLSFVVERRVGNAEPIAITLETTPVFGENGNIFSMQRQVGTIEGLEPEARSTLIGIADPKSPAAAAGMETLDVIVSVNGNKVSSWRDLESAMAAALTPSSQTIKMQVRGLEVPETTPPREITLDLSGVSDKSTLLTRAGIESGELYIYKIKPGSPAQVAGMQAKDKLLRIDDKPISAWSDVIERVKLYEPAGEPFAFTVLRNGEEKTFPLRPEMTALMNLKGQEEKRFTVGIVSGFLQVIPETVFYRVRGPVAIVRHGLQQTTQWTGFVVMSLVRLVRGDVSAKNIGGVITIGRVASNSYSAGLSAFLKTMAIISINLFLLNLLPVPILDGGHLVFFSIEALRGAPLSMRKMEIAQQVGLMLLMFLMVFAFFNDISNLISSQW